ncbi:MAG: tetratricopeptide repeat protein [Pseudohongiellaceae bacterium]
MARRAELEQALEELRSDAGVYSPVLMEAYSDLGALYTELEDFDSAVRVYNDALQIARINSGLYSEQQLPLLESLIDSQQQRSDWQAVDDLAHLHLHLHERLYARTDSNYLDAAEDYGAWRQRAINQNLLDQGSQARLSDARNLSQFYERLATI